MQLCNENIESIYVMPGLLKFEHDCLTILSRSLLSVAPEEGCALLLGTQKPANNDQKTPAWHIQKIWPCLNAWHPGLLNNSGEEENEVINHPKKLSKKNRFALDPKDQLVAQRWARKNHLQVLGVAHSHPKGRAKPSVTDLCWGMSPGLMVIVSNTEGIKAWWQYGRGPEQHHEVLLITDE